MHKILIQKAFEKAEQQLREKGDKQPSRIHIAEHLSTIIQETADFSIGEMSLRTYYRNSLDGKHQKEDINISKIRVVEGLYTYLGYDSYKEFLYSIASPQEKSKIFVKKNKYILLICLLTVITSSIITSQNRTRWMEWNGLAYVEVSFDKYKVENRGIVPYDADKVKNFRKIPNPDCNTEYFNEKGEKITWYFKRGKNDLEIFTAPGIHPVNGKTLDDITVYMIREHICPSY